MASFVLQPCKLRDDRLVPTKDEPITFAWDDLLTRVAPTSSMRAKKQLCAIQTGAYVGTTWNNNPEAMWDPHVPKQVLTNFVFLNQSRTGDVRWLLKQDPSFADRLNEVFRVEKVLWDETSLHEFPTNAREGA